MSPSVLAIVLLLMLVVFGIAAAAVGRLPGLVPAEPDVEGIGLPDGPLTADALPRVRFSVALRGYRMSEVDAFVARVREQLDPTLPREADLEAPAWQPAATEPAAPSSPSPSTSELPPL